MALGAGLAQQQQGFGQVLGNQAEDVRFVLVKGGAAGTHEQGAQFLFQALQREFAAMPRFAGARGLPVGRQRLLAGAGGQGAVRAPVFLQADGDARVVVVAGKNGGDGGEQGAFVSGAAARRTTGFEEREQGAQAGFTAGAAGADRCGGQVLVSVFMGMFLPKRQSSKKAGGNVLPRLA